VGKEFLQELNPAGHVILDSRYSTGEGTSIAGAKGRDYGWLVSVQTTPV
jgi:hypothetical protein